MGSKDLPSARPNDGVYRTTECIFVLRRIPARLGGIDNITGEPVSLLQSYIAIVTFECQAGNDEFRNLACLTTQAEWVQVYFDEFFLEECAAESRIEVCINEDGDTMWFQMMTLQHEKG